MAVDNDDDDFDAASGCDETLALAPPALTMVTMDSMVLYF